MRKSFLVPWWQRAGLPLLFLLLTWLDKRTNLPFFSLALGPVISAFQVVAFFLFLELFGTFSLGLFKRKNLHEDIPWSIRAGVGIFALYFYSLALCALHQFSYVFLVLPVVVLFWWKGAERVASATEAFKSCGTRERRLVLAVLIPALVFLPYVLHTEFARYSGDLWGHYYQNLHYILKTRSLTRLYFTTEIAIYPLVFSSLPYAYLLGMSTVHVLPFFGLGLVIVAGIGAHHVADRVLRLRQSWLAPLLLVGLVYFMRSEDLSFHLMKFSHTMTVFCVATGLYFFMRYWLEGEFWALALGAANCGVLIGDFMGPFPVFSVAMAVLLARAIRAGKIGSAMGAGAVIVGVGSIPYLINQHYCGIPLSPTMPHAGPLYGIFKPFTEFYNEIYHEIIEYWYPIRPTSFNHPWIVMMKRRVTARVLHMLLLVYAWFQVPLLRPDQRRPTRLFLGFSLPYMAFHSLEPQFYTGPRLSFLVLPLAGVHLALWGDLVGALWKRWREAAKRDKRQWLLRMAPLLGAVLLFVRAGYPSPNYFKKVAEDARWLARDYGRHHDLANEFYRSSVFRYIRRHVAEDEKIITNRWSHQIYSVQRIGLGYYNYPFYLMMARDPATYFARARTLKANYLMLTDWEGEIDPIYPYPPLFHDPSFVKQHYRIVARARISSYADEAGYYDAFTGRNPHPELRDEPEWKRFRTSYSIVLLRLSETPVSNSPEDERLLENLLQDRKFRNPFSQEMIAKIRTLAPDPAALSRMRRFDELLREAKPWLVPFSASTVWDPAAGSLGRLFFPLCRDSDCAL